MVVVDSEAVDYLGIGIVLSGVYLYTCLRCDFYLQRSSFGHAKDADSATFVIFGVFSPKFYGGWTNGVTLTAKNRT